MTTEVCNQVEDGFGNLLREAIERIIKNEVESMCLLAGEELKARVRKQLGYLMPHINVATRRTFAGSEVRVTISLNDGKPDISTHPPGSQLDFSV